MQDTLPVNRAKIQEFNRILSNYRSAKAATERRILSSENWWKLRNTAEEQKNSAIGKDGGWHSVSGWLHNVIVQKHADAMASFPEPNILPREKSDCEEARMLGAVIPCILEQNRFEQTYSDVSWQKLKTGTGAYKVTWDQSKEGGIGDISIERVNLLDLYWEGGIGDIQNSRYLFHLQRVPKEDILEAYPFVQDIDAPDAFLPISFTPEENHAGDGRRTVIEVYYHKTKDGKRTLQYCKYLGETVLYATENDPLLCDRGLYDHCRYPYEFDVLFPVEGSVCGYGFVDLCRNPQTEIDLLKTSFVKNAMVGASPRYFMRRDGAVNEEDFLDLSCPIVKVDGNLGQDAVRRIEHTSLDGVYVNLYDRIIEELRQTSGNTEVSAGNISSGVTAASAIAALQEASGKGSRDSTLESYRVFGRIVWLCIELIRQFYTLPRCFRIIGQNGAPAFVRYSNRGILPGHQGNDFGHDMGYRLPVFDIKVSAQRHSFYTKLAQNELAVQFFQLGFFNPALSAQALSCLEMMDFDGKDSVMERICQNAAMPPAMPNAPIAKGAAFPGSETNARTRANNA